MGYPQIIYDGNVLTFTYPPTKQPRIDPRTATRYDSITTSGLRQTAWERTDTFKVLNMENVLWDDAQAWADFIDFALQGGEFQYYPDSDAADFKTYELMDTDFSPAYVQAHLDKFSLKIRVVPDGASSP